MLSKVIATLGPASSNYETMKGMVLNGVRVFRLNFSHANAATFEPIVKEIRKLEEDLDIPLTIMGDLCGPKIRIGDVVGSPLSISIDTKIVLGPPEAEDCSNGHTFISLDMPELLKGLELGMPVSLSDGMLQFEVTGVIREDQCYELTARNSGMLTSHKGITFPGKSLDIKAMQPKDRVDVKEGMGIGLDAFALSFVQDRTDVEDLKAEIAKYGKWVPVVSKLERKNALENLDSIIEVSDAIMVARGDLGLECPLTELPVTQKRIIRACRHAQKPAIVATQMLLSMVNNPAPTRAETTDVANAILDGADCVMLSEETAIGKHPVEAVGFINGIASNAEKYFHERIQGPYQPKKEKNPNKYLAYAACLLADNLEAAGVICHSTSGATARLLSSRRAAQPIHALTSATRIIKWLNFYYGVNPHMTDQSVESHVDRCENFAKAQDIFPLGAPVVITAGQPTPGQIRDKDERKVPEQTSTNQIKIYYK